MIEILDLKKVFENKKKGTVSYKEALKGISFVCKPGEIFGLLGPNGAGKTTTLRCISTLIKPTSGQITVNGFDSQKNDRQVRSIIGFLTSDMKLDGFFTPDYMMDYFGSLNKMTPEAIAERKEKLVKELHMEEFRYKKIDKLSTGMKQKTSIAISLIHDPDIIIFDEPTNGLDVITAKNVTDFLKKYAKEGKTVLISTHIMSVAEQICDKIGILIDGLIKEDGTLKEIISENKANNLEDVFFKYLEVQDVE